MKKSQIEIIQGLLLVARTSLKPKTTFNIYQVGIISFYHFIYFLLSNQEIELVQRGAHLYHFSTSKKTWDMAEDFCQQHGGHLASIHSNEEQQFIIHEAYKKR